MRAGDWLTQLTFQLHILYWGAEEVTVLYWTSSFSQCSLWLFQDYNISSLSVFPISVTFPPNVLGLVFPLFPGLMKTIAFPVFAYPYPRPWKWGQVDKGNPHIYLLRCLLQCPWQAGMPFWKAIMICSAGIICSLPIISSVHVHVHTRWVAFSVHDSLKPCAELERVRIKFHSSPTLWRGMWCW